MVLRWALQNIQSIKNSNLKKKKPLSKNRKQGTPNNSFLWDYTLDNKTKQEKITYQYHSWNEDKTPKVDISKINLPSYKKRPSTAECINKLWSIYALGHNGAMKMNDLSSTYRERWHFKP